MIKGLGSTTEERVVVFTKEIPLKKCKIITYCKFCKAEGKRVRCTKMTKYAPPFGFRDHYKHYSCDECIHKISDPDPHGRREHAVNNPPQEVSRPDNHLTEADYQTWMRL